MRGPVAFALLGLFLGCAFLQAVKSEEQIRDDQGGNDFRETTSPDENFPDQSNNMNYDEDDDNDIRETTSPDEDIDDQNGDEDDDDDDGNYEEDYVDENELEDPR